MYYRRRADVRVHDVEGETLVLDHQGEKIHQLNGTASFIWQRCDGRTSLEQIVGLLVEEFEVEQSVARRDVAALVRQLCELKLLSESDRSLAS